VLRAQVRGPLQRSLCPGCGAEAHERPGDHLLAGLDLAPHAERGGEHGSEATEEANQGRLVFELALEPADVDGGAHAAPALCVCSAVGVEVLGLELQEAGVGGLALGGGAAELGHDLRRHRVLGGVGTRPVCAVSHATSRPTL
jgi:hypothetical protein